MCLPFTYGAKLTVLKEKEKNTYIYVVMLEVFLEYMYIFKLSAQIRGVHTLDGLRNGVMRNGRQPYPLSPSSNPSSVDLCVLSRWSQICDVLNTWLSWVEPGHHATMLVNRPVT